MMNPDDVKRTLSAAILLARADCCDVCRALIRVRDVIPDEAPPEPTPISAAPRNRAARRSH